MSSLGERMASLRPGALNSTDFRDGALAGAQVALETAVASLRRAYEYAYSCLSAGTCVSAAEDDLRALLAEVES